MRGQSQQKECPEADWPDLLAAALRAAPDLPLRAWAENNGLRPESLSRGFRLAYGTTPKAYRAAVRTRAALAAIRRGLGSLSQIAAETGFADPAHMTRAVVALTRRPPRSWLTAPPLAKAG